jgi:hypothetical protein
VGETALESEPGGRRGSLRKWGFVMIDDVMIFLEGMWDVCGCVFNILRASIVFN